MGELILLADRRVARGPDRPTEGASERPTGRHPRPAESQVERLSDRATTVPAAPPARRARHERAAPPAQRARGLVPTDNVVFFYALDCPFSYLTAERVERVLGEVEWVPVAGLSAEWASPRRSESAQVRRRAEHLAAELRLPLVWPDHSTTGASSALRVAAKAGKLATGARFALAASRLAFCGGFNLEDPEILAEAAAAAGLPLAHCLAAARDTSLDQGLLDGAYRLRAQGITQLPAVCAERRWYQGDSCLTQAEALLTSRADTA